MPLCSVGTMINEFELSRWPAQVIEFTESLLGLSKLESGPPPDAPVTHFVGIRQGKFRHRFAKFQLT